ncbi:10238_t:CDS:2 [Diversispora eburnea]|uniref:10238_t:CDS:1 n=1 Tax=Diversispora eburnea TaxID=1213867 RepID=A0A9N8YN81_9GLOM|nr:10238_t:CDS:2 [Diversispora eburnea]
MNTEEQTVQTEKLSKEAYAYKFWQEFQEERTVIQKSLKELYLKPKSKIPSLCEGILQRINELEKKATDAIRFLPAYDQRQTNLQVRDLIEDLIKEISEIKTSNNEKLQTITINDHQNTYININSYLNSSSSESKVFDFQISNLDHCIVNLVNSTVSIGAIHIKGLKNTIIMSGLVGSSILIYDCERCSFLVGCHQFRMHTSKQMIIYLHVTSHPIIEDCHDIEFAPYTLTNPGLNQMFETANLDQANNKYDKVEDFNWLRKQASPNWRVIPIERLRKDWSLLEVDDPNNITEESIKSILNKILFTPN